MNQQEYGRICTFLRSRELPNVTKNKKDVLRRSKDFKLIDGLLHYYDKRRKVDLQVCMALQLAKCECDSYTSINISCVSE